MLIHLSSNCTPAGPALGGVGGPIGNNFSRSRFPVNLQQRLYLYVLDKPRVDYTLAQSPFMGGGGGGGIWEQLVQLGKAGPGTPTAVQM